MPAGNTSKRPGGFRFQAFFWRRTSVNTEMTDTTNRIENKASARMLSGLLSAAVTPVFTLASESAFPSWVWMWSIAGALFVGAKWITVSRFLRSAHTTNPARLFAYCVLWPGMDVRAFCTSREVEPPSFREWAGAAGKMILGALLTWVSLNR